VLVNQKSLYRQFIFTLNIIQENNMSFSISNEPDPDFPDAASWRVFNSANGTSIFFRTYEIAADYVNFRGGSATPTLPIPPANPVAVYKDAQQANVVSTAEQTQFLVSQNQANATGNSPLAGVPPGADPEEATSVQEGRTVELNTGRNLQVDEFGFSETGTGLNLLPEDQETGVPDGYLVEVGAAGNRVLNPQQVSLAQEQATAEAAARDRARQQQTISQQRRQINDGDWRVRLRLAPGAKYLYKADRPGILQPLAITDGVIFPYTPTITSNYKANYGQYDLTHSNYRGYFYQSSYAEPVQISCMFTAQSTVEANYLLAVITFFKSVTKMFYGQDAQRGAPPPLTYLTGLGEYQFNEHPCVVSQFNYTLPADVDYIRAGSPNQLGLNQINQRDRQSVSTGSSFGGLNRLAAALLTKGAIPNPPAPPTLVTNRPTYVPTKIELSMTLLPIQSRNQISKQFSVKNFANGNLIKGGFW
jgi:hypothetical protein